MLISKKLLKLLESKRITQKELATNINLSYGGLRAMIKADDYRISVLESISKCLEVPINYFFDDKEIASNQEDEKYKFLIQRIADLESDKEFLKRLVEGKNQPQNQP